MRHTRFMSLFFAVLALAFLAVPAFRQAFELPLTVILFRGGVDRFTVFAPADLERWTREGEASRDAQALAFVAMHSKSGSEAFRVADEATAIDPGLNWIYFSLAWVDRSGLQAEKIAQKLQALDPQNSLGYLQEAEYLREKAKPRVEWLLMEQRAAQTEWRAAMQKAFTAPHYNSYHAERFDLERKFLLAHNIATPLRMNLSVSSYPIPNLLNIRQYAELLTRDVGAEAEKAGRTDEALAQYWTAAHAGERMRLAGGSLMEELIGTGVEQLGYKALMPVLQNHGQGEMASTMSLIMAEQAIRTNQARGRDDIFVAVSNYTWTAFLIYVLEALAVYFAAITVIAFAYVNAKRWVRPDYKGRMFTVITVAENYMPIATFLACAGLYLVYYPYAVNFRYYMTAPGTGRDYEALIRNTMPLPDILVGQQLPIGNPLLPYAWYALAGLVLVLAIAAVTRSQAKQETPQPKAMAADAH